MRDFNNWYGKHVIPTRSDHSDSYYQELLEVLSTFGELVNYINNYPYVHKGYIDSKISDIEQTINTNHVDYLNQIDELRNKFLEELLALEIKIKDEMVDNNNVIMVIIENLKLSVATQLENLEGDFEHKLTVFKGDITKRFEDFREEIRRTLEQQGKDVLVMNPVNRELQPLTYVLRNMFETSRYFGITAREFDLYGLSAEEYDEMGLTALEHDLYGRLAVRWKSRNARSWSRVTSPVSGKRANINVALGHLSALSTRDSKAITALKFDTLSYSVGYLDSLKITAYEFDFKNNL